MSRRLQISNLLRPHRKALGFGLLAVIGDGIADLLQPWPLKIVLQYVGGTKDAPGWLNRTISSVIGTDRLTVLKFAAIASLVIAIMGAICSYAQKYLTTSVGQWVTHDLRRGLYHHIQRLSLSFHDKKQ